LVEEDLDSPRAQNYKLPSVEKNKLIKKKGMEQFLADMKKKKENELKKKSEYVIIFIYYT
jgi:hypothetical protein